LFPLVTNSFRFKLRSSSVLKLTAGLLLIVVLGVLTWAGLNTLRAFQFLQTQDLSSAQAASTRALPIVRSISQLTLHQLPDIELWRLGLETVNTTPEVIQSITQNLLTTQETASSHSLRSSVNQLQTLAQLYQKSWIIRRLTPAQAPRIEAGEALLSLISNQVLTGKKRYLILFQNNQELRATGGFIGSYAQLDLDQGAITSLEVFDIYQPDGQFLGYIPAPPGVREYLSSGRGLRLPDANWWADFPASAQQILAFFALGKTNQIDGVISLNLDLVIELLKITGPIYVPDYQVTVTPGNVAEVLRYNREDFFPGSIAKQQLLSAFFTQLRFKLPELIPIQQRQILSLVQAQLTTKNIQIYAQDIQLQNWLIQQRLAGAQSAQPTSQSQPADWYLYPIESNVGINKVNAAVERQTKITIETNSSELTTTFTNSSPDQPYINYQRLFFRPSFSLSQLSINGQPVTTWDEEAVSLSNGEQQTQAGWLMTVPPNSTAAFTVQLAHPPLVKPLDFVLQKQSGLSPIPIEVSYTGQTQKFLMITDIYQQL